MAISPRKVIEAISEIYKYSADLDWSFERIVADTAALAEDLDDEKLYRMAEKIDDIYYSKLEKLLDELREYIGELYDKYEQMV